MAKSGTRKAREQALRGSHRRHAQDLRGEADERRGIAQARRAQAAGSRVASTQIMRSPSQGEHKGAEVAKMLATGEWRTARKGTDAAGPLREDVGCTSTLVAGDYRSRALDDRPLATGDRGAALVAAPPRGALSPAAAARKAARERSSAQVAATKRQRKARKAGR